MSWGCKHAGPCGWAENDGYEWWCETCVRGGLLVAAGTEPVYPGGGLAFTELQPAAGDQRAALAELANDSQNMGTYDGWPEAGVADFLARDRQQRAGEAP